MITKTPTVNWKKGGGLLPAIIQDACTKQVLMLGYMNRAAFTKTLRTKRVWFYSRSKKRLWMKGEMSGNILRYKSSVFDCDKDALLIQAIPKGPTCHTGTPSCFGEAGSSEAIFDELLNIIKSRKRTMQKKSYTTYLFRKGLSKICAKIKEESGEVIRAAKKESRKRLTEESVDLIYHLLVLLAEKNISFVQVCREMKRRRQA